MNGSRDLKKILVSVLKAKPFGFSTYRNRATAPSLSQEGIIRKKETMPVIRLLGILTALFCLLLAGCVSTSNRESWPWNLEDSPHYSPDWDN